MEVAPDAWNSRTSSFQDGQRHWIDAGRPHTDAQPL